jgi:cyclophilin family peptidyl-prolyl cis-trans isomerase
MMSVKTRFVKASLVAGMFLAFAATSTAQYTNGIYAEFNTSMGSYTCRLEYAIAPKTVANFIALSSGQRSWLDLPTGVTKTNPFYNGTTFHRIIAGFMNQGGSKNALGTDDAGYKFVDEFSPSLRHDSFGVLSMANSGPDSNGAQFFITVSPQPSLDDVHSVLGKLYGGSNVVYAINHVATGANDKPLTNVTVNSIAIRRVGAGAIAFDINTNGLPLVTNLNIARVGTNVSLTYSNRLYADNRLYSSTSLSTWNATPLGIEVLAGFTNATFRSAAAPKEFFRMAQIQYPASLFVPRNVLNKTLTLNYTAGNGTIIYSFNSTGGGTYTWTLGPPGAISGYNWAQDPYRGRFLPIGLSGVIPMNLHLDYDSATVGTFKGTALPNYPSSFGSFPVSGTFSSTP